MQPLALGRGFIASGALFHGRAIKNVGVFNSTARIFAQRYARGAGAAEWNDAADAYFGKESGNENVASGNENLAMPKDPAPKKLAENAKSRVVADREESLTRKLKRTTKVESSNPRWKTNMRDRHGGEDAQDEEDVPETRSRIESGRAKELPVGMQRLKRPFVRNRPGFPVLRKGGYQHRRSNQDDEDDDDDRVSEVPKLRGEPLYGLGPVKAAIQARRRDLHVLYVQEKLEEGGPGKKKVGNEARGILKIAENIELATVTTSKHVLNMLSDNRPHQGMVLDASPLELVEVKSLENPLVLGDKVPIWIALDEVQDPQNFGAILRSAYFFGASGVVVCAKNSAPLSGVVSKASAGALETMELLSCRNMVKFLQSSIVNGWRAVGSSLDERCVTVKDIPKDVPTILVLGNEGVGIRTNVMAACSDMVRIGGALKSRKRKDVEDTQGEVAKLLAVNREEEWDEDAVDSLNVSVAAGVLLHEFLNRK